MRARSIGRRQAQSKRTGVSSEFRRAPLKVPSKGPLIFHPLKESLKGTQRTFVLVTLVSHYVKYPDHKNRSYSKP